MKRSLTLFLALLCLTARAQQAAPERLIAQLKARYPNTDFSQMRPSPIAGLYEVVIGKTIAYTDPTGRYFLFGHLFDMQTQLDLTAQHQQESRQAVFSISSLKNALQTVQGDGRRVFAVFSDPDCPYCQQLESELARLANVTIYTFLYPLESLHPDAKTKAMSIWCAPDPVQAWREWMQAGKAPKQAACPHPIDDNLRLGARLGVAGTPTLIAADGRLRSGVASAEEINRWLEATGSGEVTSSTGQGARP